MKRHLMHAPPQRGERAYKSSGQFLGCSSLSPVVRTESMSSGGTSSYGILPSVITSHSTTPNDHCEGNSLIWYIVTIHLRGLFGVKQKIPPAKKSPSSEVS